MRDHALGLARRWRLTGLALLLLSCLLGCAREAPRPTPPAPTVIEVPVRVYVPIPDEMTQLCKWAREAPPSQVFDVTEGRRRCLLRYEAQLKAVKSVQDRPVPEEGGR